MYVLRLINLEILNNMGKNYFTKLFPMAMPTNGKGNRSRQSRKQHPLKEKLCALQWRHRFGVIIRKAKHPGLPLLHLAINLPVGCWLTEWNTPYI